MLNKKKYSKFLKNKRVILIGPAWHTKNTDQTKKINSYDVIVRMNAGFVLSEKIQKDIGCKTDVLYCSFSKYFLRKDMFNAVNIGNTGIKWIIGTGHHQIGMFKNVISNIDNHINIDIIDKERHKDVIYKAGTKKKITSGIITVFDLLQYDIRELYITGFTFYNIFFKMKKKKYYYKGYMPGYSSRASTAWHAHDNKKEFYYFKKICQEDKRVVCDETLKNIIERN
jgi:hypothetical protein